MVTFLTPGMALLNRLSYPRKFAVISLIFLLPLIVTMWVLLGELQQRIDFSQRELYGTTYLRPLHALREDIAKEAYLVEALANGNDSVAPQLAMQRAMIETDINALEQVEQQYGTMLHTWEEYSLVKENWLTFRATPNSATPAILQQRHAELLRAIAALYVRVGDTSNLILDPDLDTYYLMDAVLLRLPEAQAIVHDLQIHTSRHFNQPVTDQDAIRQLTIYLGQLDANAAISKQNFATAAANNPSGTLTPLIITPVRAYLDAHAQLQLDSRTAAAVNGYPEALLQATNTTITANTTLWTVSADALDDLLTRRIDGFRAKRSLVVASSSLGLLLVAYMFAAFYLATRRTIAALGATAHHLVAGSTSGAIHLDTRDELGEIAVSFNHIASAMLTAQAQRQAVVEHAADGILTMDQAGVIQFANPAAGTIFGYTSAALIGQTVQQLMPGYQYDLAVEGARFESEGMRQDGSSVPIEMALRAVDVQGETLVVCMVRDLTAERAAAQERERMHQAIIQTQAETLRQLASPVIPLSQDVLVMPLIGAVDQERAEQIMETLLQTVAERRARVTIIDVTGLPTIDLIGARTLLQTKAALELLGARLIMTGVHPGVASMLAALDVDLRRLLTSTTLEGGIALAQQLLPRSAQRRQLH